MTCYRRLLLLQGKDAYSYFCHHQVLRSFRFPPFCFHCSVHPTQSEYFNSPNTGRFTVNTGFCSFVYIQYWAFSQNSWLVYHFGMAKYHDLLTVSQEGNRCRKTVPHKTKKDKKFFTDSKHEMRKPQFLSEGQRSLKIIDTFMLGC